MILEKKKKKKNKNPVVLVKPDDSTLQVRFFYGCGMKAETIKQLKQRRDVTDRFMEFFGQEQMEANGVQFGKDRE